MPIEVTEEIVESVKGFLKEDGINFFKEIVKEHGEVDAVFIDGGIPHSVHFREGMQVRNHLRRSGLCNDWDSHDLDNNWIEVIERAIK
jgi:hypothetical protein